MTGLMATAIAGLIIAIIGFVAAARERREHRDSR